MRKSLILLVFLIISITGLLSFSAPCFAASEAAQYLCDFGISYYRQGRYDDALSAFNKVLLVDPANGTAKTYIDKIFSLSTSQPSVQPLTKVVEPVKIQKITPKADVKAVPEMKQSVQPVVKAQSKSPDKKTIDKAQDQAFKKAAGLLKQENAVLVNKPKAPALKKSVQIDEYSREDIMNNTLENALTPLSDSEEEMGKEPMTLGGIAITGEVQARMGFTSDEAIWKRANWDMNERNWRLLSQNAHNNGINTFDYRIYDRLKMNLDTNKEDGFDFHSNVTVDPWSWTGKSARVTTPTSAFGDTADIQLLYWSNTGYTINQTVFTNRLGNSINLPESKVVRSGVDGFLVPGAFDPSDTFTIPQLKIYRQFQPVREAWFDYKQKGLKLRFLPIGYENQALNFDDPLKLSNNRTWWEDSPWTRAWKHGNENSGLTPVDFTKGYYDNSLSYFVRDSEGQRLTSLRGVSLDYAPSENTSLVSSLSSPKGYWQDYSEVDNVISATRLKHMLKPYIGLGFSFTTRLGLNVDTKDRVDNRNHVVAGDLSYEIFDGLLANAEVATSRYITDISSSEYKTKYTGGAYYFSLTGRLPRMSIINVPYGYAALQPGEDEKFFNKFRFFVARMDANFNQSLSSYSETRDDEFWGRHLHFRRPFQYYYQGEGQMLTWDDISSFRVGNGIDKGRNTIGLRIESKLWDNKVENFFDVRNVHGTNNKFIENVARNETKVKITDKLSSKFLGIYQEMPRTKGGYDPYLFNSLTGLPYQNTSISDGVDPSIGTASFGAEYEFTDWLSWNGIYEFTNDITLGYDGFPRNVFSSNNMGYTYLDSDRYYRELNTFLYNQQYFPAPPYRYYDIFKTGLRFAPLKNLEFYVDYTYNDYKLAGPVDDNMNHVGFECSYMPSPKFSMFLRYTFSRWRDLNYLSINTDPTDHHNFFAEFTYRKSENEDFTFQYGEAMRDPYMGGVLDIGYDPFGGSMKTIDTEHIFRLYYRRKF